MEHIWTLATHPLKNLFFKKRICPFFLCYYHEDEQIGDVWAENVALFTANQLKSEHIAFFFFADIFKEVSYPYC